MHSWTRSTPLAEWSNAVDLANGFAKCWTFDGTFADVEEWARQLKDEIDATLERVYGNGE